MKGESTLVKKLLTLLILLVFSEIVGATQEITLWHSLDGPLGEQFALIVNRFNQRPDIVATGLKVVPYYKGTYEQTLAEGLQAIQANKTPHILQIYEMGNLVMQSHPNAYIPLNQLTDTQSPLLKSERFIPYFSAFYKGHSLPFSASTVVLFYNKDAFRKAGLNPEHPPATWEEFEKIAKILKKQGSKNILASGWLAGHHIDQLGAWHNIPVATKGNGVDGEGARLVVNRKFFIDHLNKLAAWYQTGLFSLDNRVKAEKAFAKGEVVILTHGANRLSLLEKLVNGAFEIGVGYFPYWEGKIGAPQNTVAGGASFWVMAGHQPKDYSVIQQFFEYLASPTIQAEWHQKTCYIPVVIGAEMIAENQQFYEQGIKGRAAKIALDSISKNKPKEYSRGILLPQFPKVREMMVQELKEAIKGNKTSEQALNQIVKSGNKIMQEGSQN